MLLRISIIVAILAGLAVGGLNFVKVKEKVVNLANDRDNEKSMKEKAQTELAKTKDDLNKTTAKLKTTETELVSTKDELATAAKRLQTTIAERDSTRKQLDDTRKERDDARAELAAFQSTELTPPQIIAMNKQYKSLQAENQFLARLASDRALKIRALTNELAIYKFGPDQVVVTLPADLKGKVLVTDPKWNFVVVNVGQDQGVLERGELLVNRNGRLVAKVIVRSVQKDRSVANVMPGWQLGEVMEGDLVIPAHPEIKESTNVTAASATTGSQLTAVRQ
jgi:hypothetical protein